MAVYKTKRFLNYFLYFETLKKKKKMFNLIWFLGIFVVSINADANKYKYKKYENTDFISTCKTSFTLDSSLTKSQSGCLIKCNKIDSCKAISFEELNATINCFLYSCSTNCDQCTSAVISKNVFIKQGMFTQ